jgi:hypothetical protein
MGKGERNDPSDVGGRYQGNEFGGWAEDFGDVKEDSGDVKALINPPFRSDLDTHMI